LNEFLDEICPISPVTNREILNTFLHGHYAHTNEDKQAKYNEWTKDVAIFTNLKTMFLVIVATMFANVRELRLIVKRLLEAEPTEG
jgi:hypothetical protein